MPTIEKRVAALEGKVETMDIGLKEHFAEFRTFVVESLDGVEKRLTAQITGVETRLGARLDSVDARLDSVDARLNGVDARLDRVDARLNSVDARLDSLDGKLDLLIARAPRRSRVVRKRRP
jgi:hypothetical protein